MAEPQPVPKGKQPILVDVGPQQRPVAAKSTFDAAGGVEEILAGRGDARDLVGLVAQLDGNGREQLRTKLVKVASVATGDITLQIGELVGASFSEVIPAALGSSHGVPTSTALQRRLATATSSDLGALDDATADRLATRFAGQALLAVAPQAASLISKFANRISIIRWLVKTTPAGVLAEIMGNGGSQRLGEELDKHDLWKPWIDHVRLALPSYASLADGTKDPGVIAKLLAPYGRRAKQADGGIEVEVPDTSMFEELEVAVVTGAQKERLLAAINAAGFIEPRRERDVISALRRVGASADEILGAVGLAAEPSVEWLRALLDAPGVTSPHVMRFVGLIKTLPLVALTEALVRQLRAKAGKALHLHQIVKRNAESHKAIVETELLREWFLEDATPADLFWFCVEEPALVTKATRVVVARSPDWAWVRKLTGAESHVQLRSLAIACNHAATAKFIREYLVHDAVGVATFDQERTSTKAYGGQLERLHEAIEQGAPDVVIERLSDLDNSERRTFGKNATSVAELAAKASFKPDQFTRAAHLIELSYSLCLAHCPRGREILTHLRTRPPAEEAVALADPALVTRAVNVVSEDLLLVFPSLGDLSVLAKALARDPNLLGMLLSGSGASRVIDLIATEPVATPAIAAFAKNVSALASIPAYEHLSTKGRGFVDRMAKSPQLSARGLAIVERIRSESVDERILSNDKDEKSAVERAATAHEIDTTSSLPEAIDKLFEADVGTQVISVLLASHKAQVPHLLTEPQYWPRVGKLGRRLRIAPALVCPFISPELLLQMPNALRWYFELGDPMVLLHLVLNSAAANTVSQHLGADVPSARAWLESMPRGAALTSEERRQLDLLEQATANRDVIHQLFLTKYDVPPPAYGAGDLDSLYRIVSRLPASHLNQKRIKGMFATDNAVPGSDGTYNPARREITIGTDQHEGAGGPTFHPEPLRETSDEGWLTADELKRAYGYDDATIAAHIKAKNLVVRDLDGLTVYRMKPVKVDSFTQVVLHEIGHSIDQILGSHTEVVFEFAGWHQFNDNQFDTWAGEMGGWERVTTPDKLKIRQAWNDAALEKRGVRDLVPPDHPALAEAYADVGIVKMGRQGRKFSAWDRDIINGRMFVAGSYIGRWYSVDAAIVPSAPSYYSLYAPQEYFAESYVEYYRQVDGTAGSEKKKGGALAAPVKKFFDERVDALRYDPERFEKKEAEKP